MMATLKFGSQHQTVISPAKAAVDANRLAPPRAAAVKRDRMDLRYMVSSQGNWRQPGLLPAGCARFTQNGRRRNRNLVNIYRTAKGIWKVSGFQRVAAAVAPDQLGCDAHLLAIGAA